MNAHRSSLRECLLAGRDYDDGLSDVAWCRHKHHDSRLITTMGYAFRKVLRHATSRVTFDAPSFQRALAARPEGSVLVLAPSHRSYFDFLLTCFLSYQHPELGLGAPQIAAAEEFSKIPVLSPFLAQAGAFFVRRDVGRELPELNAQLERIAELRQSLMFFIEGKRSRDRSFLEPKRGLLRGLQATGKSFYVLPLALSYDRLPEEAGIEREILLGKRPKMSAAGVLRWLARLAQGDVELGHIHLACGTALTLGPDTDVRELARRVVDEQRRATVVTDFHLHCFASEVPEVDPSWLARALEERGQRVLASPLRVPQVSPVLSRTLKNQWLPSFAADAVRLYPESALLAREARRHRWEHEAPCADPRVRSVVSELFGPVASDYARVAKVLRAPHPARESGPPRGDAAQLLAVEPLLRALAAEGALEEPEKGRFVWKAPPELVEEFHADIERTKSLLSRAS